MPRPLWKGAVSFGLVHIPVVLSSAENRNSFDLTMLDRRNMKPVGFQGRSHRFDGAVEAECTGKGSVVIPLEACIEKSGAASSSKKCIKEM